MSKLTHYGAKMALIAEAKSMADWTIEDLLRVITTNQPKLLDKDQQRIRTLIQTCVK